jgi:hypothetical protein
MVLQMLFGLTYTAVAKYIQFARRIVIKVLKQDPLAKIAIPSHEKLEEYCALIDRCHPALPDVWGTMDGLKIKIDEAPDEITQSRFYNGWKHSHFVTAILCFAPDGSIPACYYNVLGCLMTVLLLIGASWSKCSMKLGSSLLLILLFVQSTFLS